jgi:hypothetical protein
MGRKVHVLAIVIDYTASQEGSRLPSNVTLMDRTGQNATLVLWKDVGRQILGVIRKGDVLYLGSALIPLLLSFSLRSDPFLPSRRPRFGVSG